MSESILRLKDDERIKLARTLKSQQQTRINRYRYRVPNYKQAVELANRDLAQEHRMTVPEVEALCRWYTIKIMSEGRTKAAERRREMKFKTSEPTKKTMRAVVIEAEHKLAKAPIVEREEMPESPLLAEFGLKRMWVQSLRDNKMERYITTVLAKITEDSYVFFEFDNTTRARQAKSFIEKKRAMLEENGKYEISYRLKFDKVLRVEKIVRKDASSS